MTSRTYRVPGMTCDHCRAAIDSALAGVPGIGAVDVHLDTKEVDVSGTAEETAVRQAINDAGYDVAGVR